MARKLTQTNFTYSARLNGGAEYRATGSYLGRRKASAETIRRFLARNARDTGCTIEVVSLEVGSSFLSPWIHR